MRSRIRPLLATLGVVLSFGCLPIMAATLPSTGLGQPWPNASDVSVSPYYHVYVFERLGVRYVQVNDMDGTVRGAFAYSGSQIMGLPIGVDANRLGTPGEGVQEGAVTSSAATVYDDGTVKVNVQPMSEGTARLLMLPSECKNPAECSVKGP